MNNYNEKSGFNSKGSQNENQNFSYYPESIFIKDGKISTQAYEQQNTNIQNFDKNNLTNTKNSTFNINNLMPLLNNNKNLTDLLPLLLAKQSGGNIESMSKLINNFNHTKTTESKPENKKITHQNYIDEL